jgi:hypothetical protein
MPEAGREAVGERALEVLGGAAVDASTRLGSSAAISSSP